MHLRFRKLHSHAQHTAATTLRDPVRNQQGTVHHRIILATDFFVPGVQQQVFDGLRQWLFPPFFELGIQHFCRTADLHGRDLKTAHLFQDCRNLAGRNSVNVHFRHSNIDRTLAAHPFFKAGRIKTAISRLRDGQLNLALKRIDGTRFEPVSVVCSQVRTLIRTCMQIVLTFHLHCFVEKHLHDFTQTVKTFFRNDLQNRLRHAKFFHCDKSSRFVFREG